MCVHARVCLCVRVSVCVHACAGVSLCAPACVPNGSSPSDRVAHADGLLEAFARRSDAGAFRLQMLRCMTLTQIETASERARGQPHPAHGRCDSGSTSSTTNRAALSSEWPTSAQAGRRSSCEVHAPLGANRTADARSEFLLQMTCPDSSRSPFRRCPIDEERPRCHAFDENICCVHHCHLPLTDLDRSCSSFAGDSWRALPTAGDGRWAPESARQGKGEVRGCSRRLPDQPSRHRLRR
jgi:hypothetical protein